MMPDVKIVFTALGSGAFVLSFFCWKSYERLARLYWIAFTMIVGAHIL
jgi:hypothetical protein